ncbi:polyprenyl diphosphate synthase [Acidisoma cladoniae]|jgi:undecaprenyl diphosphate synthase|uniref:polyprenyl diphosphate synthase n=1 Tax=Acidisoma cladoniae TaxID=3040935 RepID=UPI003D9CAC10
MASDLSTAAIRAEAPRAKAGGGAAAVPCHVALIMDGNGRWAKARGLPRVAGHHAGAKAVRRCIEAAIDSGIEWLTLYAFSSENWRRPAAEVTDLTTLLRQYLRSELKELGENGVRFRVIGERGRFSPELRAEFDRAERHTADNRRLNLTIALSYGGRTDILAAARDVARAAKAGEIDPETLDEDGFCRFLSTSAMPDPDLLIRTSGEQRLSNFLLWECAYAELVFLDVLWPDFCAQDLTVALAEFGRRERRYGANVD